MPTLSLLRVPHTAAGLQPSFDDDDDDDVTSPGGLAGSPVRSKAPAATVARELSPPSPGAAALQATPLVRAPCLSTRSVA